MLGTISSPAELEELAWLDDRRREVYSNLLPLEGPLLDTAREYLIAHPEEAIHEPALGLLLHPIPPGRWEEALELALQVGRNDTTGVSKFRPTEPGVVQWEELMNPSLQRAGATGRTTAAQTGQTLTVRRSVMVTTGTGRTAEVSARTRSPLVIRTHEKQSR